MGTRNLVCVVKDGEYKIAQYGQWDGYPEGQGFAALAFLKGEMDRSLFEEKLDTLSWLTEEEHKAQWAECGADSEWVTMDVADKHKRLYPENSRDTGAGILSLVQESEKPLKLNNGISFASDSLFCEWAWVIDLDKNTFEGYEGFNEKPLEPGERFYEFPTTEGHDGTVYYPVRLVASFDLNALPDRQDFLRAFKEED